MDKHEEIEDKEMIDLGQEFMAIANKPTSDRDIRDEDRKQEILTILRKKIPQSQLNEMIQDALRTENRIKQRERAAELRRQQAERNVVNGNINEQKEMKESKEQDSSGLPLPQAQRENGQHRGRRPSIEMIVTFDEDNGVQHSGQNSEGSKSRTVTPIEQPQPNRYPIVIEAPKEKSKTPEQKTDLQMGTDSEPPTIPPEQKEEKRKSDSEPTMLIEHIV